MARKPNPENPESERKGRSFKPDATSFKSMVEGETIRGFFLGRSSAEIKDRRTGAPKTLQILKLRGEDEAVIKLPMAAMMQRAWEDICDEYGGGDEDSAVQKLRGVEMEITRGKDMRTADKNPMGTYEITIFE